MARKKTDGRVKRTDQFHLTNLANDLNAHKASLHTLRQKNRALESRLAAMEAESERLQTENAALKAERDARKDKQCFNCGRSPASGMED